MMYVMASRKKLVCYDYIRSYKNIFQKYISRYFFPLFKLFFIVAAASCLCCCALTMALGTDYIISELLIPGLLELLKSETYLVG